MGLRLRSGCEKVYRVSGGVFRGLRDILLYMASSDLIDALYVFFVTRPVFVRRQVVCEVISVHWDRVDVKVAVRYPKSYGPRDGTRPKSRLHAMDDDGEAEVEVS